MSKKSKHREEPKLNFEDLEWESHKVKEKKWPTDTDTHQKPETEEEHISGILEHPSYKELEEKLTDAEKKANEYWNQQLRIQAELENTRRRCERDVSNAYQFSIKKLIEDLLPVLDSLEQAQQIEVHGNEYAQKMHDGIALTLSMLLKSLEKNGVKQINPEQEPFNPDLQQAISTEKNPDLPDNTVVKVLQKGYILNDRLVRPAMVIVSKV
jgi:molecular chaperone GrpE